MPSQPAFLVRNHEFSPCTIPQDFDSPCLKTKQHYNSFTTPFFLDAELWVIPRLGSAGHLNPEELRGMAGHVRRPLECHRCGEVVANMPKLKEHLHRCHATPA